MSGPAPPVAAVRLAVRRCLADLPDGALVLVACSGGADSLALAAATGFEARRGARPPRWRAGLLTVDHRLQAGSAQRAEQVRAWAVGAGFAPVEVLAVDVGRVGGPEAAARAARYAALDAAADRLGAAAVLLGHTRDDQAETVLLGLARGSGARALAGMAPTRGRYRRPLLDLPRARVRAACVAEGLTAWEDPHNADPAYARSRIRALLPALERAAPGAIVGLARTARQARADADALDAAAAAAYHGTGLDCAALAGLRTAIRTRVLHLAARAAGVPAGSLSSAHVDAMDELVVDWSGQGPVHLPGGVSAVRRSGRLQLRGPHRPSRPAEERPVDDHIAETGVVGGALAEPGVGGVCAADAADIESVVVTEKDLQNRIEELAAAVAEDYAGRQVLLVGVLKGAFVFMADFVRALPLVAQIDFMAVSSYGQSTSSSGVVRILKDLDRDIAGRHVILVEDVIDSGLTLSWLLRNLASRNPASLEVVALLRKREAVRVELAVRYVGFDIPNEFVVGYGLDYAERYRGLPYVAVLKPSVYGG